MLDIFGVIVFSRVLGIKRHNKHSRNPANMNYFPRWRWWARFFRDDGVFIFLSFSFSLFGTEWRHRSSFVVWSFFFLVAARPYRRWIRVDWVDRSETHKKKEILLSRFKRSLYTFQITISSHQIVHDIAKRKGKKQNACVKKFELEKVKGS
jgi:hypothetical protein